MFLPCLSHIPFMIHPCPCLVPRVSLLCPSHVLHMSLICCCASFLTPPLLLPPVNRSVSWSAFHMSVCLYNLFTPLPSFFSFSLPPSLSFSHYFSCMSLCSFPPSPVPPILTVYLLVDFLSLPFLRTCSPATSFVRSSSASVSDGAGDFDSVSSSKSNLLAFRRSWRI